MKFFQTSLYSLILRGITMASKFILLLYMARLLTPSEVGIYGMISANVALCLYFLGMDFYVFNTREILHQEENNRSRFIRDQLVFHGVMYLIILPLLLIVFVVGFIPWEYVWFFYALLVLEHLCQESYRLLITLSHPIIANIVLFLRSGAWIYAVVAAMFFANNTRNIYFICLGWVLGSSLSLLITYYFLNSKSYLIFRGEPINWPWIVRGLKSSSIFLFATISFKTMEYADRFFIKYYHGDAMVGIYSFYAQIANVIQTFVFTGTIMILSPKILTAFRQKQFNEYCHLVRILGYSAIGGAILLAVTSGFAINIVLRWVNKELYTSHITVYWVMLISMVLLVVAELPNLGLYVRHKDSFILKSALIAVSLTIICHSFLVPMYGILGAAFGNLLGALILLLSKWYFISSVNNAEQSLAVKEQELSYENVIL